MGENVRHTYLLQLGVASNTYVAVGDYPTQWTSENFAKLLHAQGYFFVS